MSQSSQQNRFLLAAGGARNAAGELVNPAEQENQLSVDDDFDSYWEEEARNPHRNRIRIGRQYQATVPPLLKSKLNDARKLQDLETLAFCPKKSAKLSDAELEHYFTVAKSLNLFASLVETRSLLGRDVTIADLNRIRNKEGLSLASVIQPPARQQPASAPPASFNPTAASDTHAEASAGQLQANQIDQPAANCENNRVASSLSPSSNTLPCQPPTTSPNNALATSEVYTFNQPLMKALSHFISLHHPCHHDPNCKKLLKDIPLAEESATPSTSLKTGGSLRQTTYSASSSSLAFSKDPKPGRSRSSVKQAAAAAAAAAAALAKDDTTIHSDQRESDVSSNELDPKTTSIEDWTREDVELFSKAIEVCGKNFSSIKKDFLPSKSVKSIVKFYYIGTRDSSEGRKKSNQTADANDGCTSVAKTNAANNSPEGQQVSGPSGKSAPMGAASSIAKSANQNLSSSIADSRHASSSTSRNTLADDADQPRTPTKSQPDLSLINSRTPTESNRQDSTTKGSGTPKQSKIVANHQNGVKAKPKSIDARMSIYNFDDELKEESPVRFECPKPGSEVKPLKAKPIMANNSMDLDATNSNVGSLKFFMDGQLVLKLNACQEQQEGSEKCHWVQSGDRIASSAQRKKHSKRGDRSESQQNGSHSDSMLSSFQDDDSKQGDLSGDEDSKESMNSLSNLSRHLQNNQQRSPLPKRMKIKNEPSPMTAQSPSPMNYNRSASVRPMDTSDSVNPQHQPTVANPVIPWPNSFAMAAALLSGLPFQSSAGNLINTSQQDNTNNINVLTSKPMDLSVEHNVPKPSSRSRSRQKNNQHPSPR